MSRAAWVAGVWLLLAGCGSPERRACVSACEAGNKCTGAKQQRCQSLCDAVPDGCTTEFRDYWSCAADHPEDACGGYLNACGTEFAKHANCITAWCFTHPLDAACYY